MMKVRFLVVPCESVYSSILGRYSFSKLDKIVSKFHLKMKYHHFFNELLIIPGDLNEALIIHETTSQDPHSAILALMRQIKETHALSIDTIGLDMEKMKLCQVTSPTLEVETKVLIRCMSTETLLGQFRYRSTCRNYKGGAQWSSIQNPVLQD